MRRGDLNSGLPPCPAAADSETARVFNSRTPQVQHVEREVDDAKANATAEVLRAKEKELAELRAHLPTPPSLWALHLG